MPIAIGAIEAIFRYPVKSMRGEPLDAAEIGFHGVEGDRRLALHRLDDRGGFPWLSASKLPELVLFSPERQGEGASDALPTHVRTPDGNAMPLFGDELAAEIGGRLGSPVRMMHLNRGIFDDATISVITSDTAREVCRLAGTNEDIRRFRPNVVVRSVRAIPFEEDEWVGGVLRFGDGDAAPGVAVTARDVRCVMVNIDPDNASRSPEVMKAVVRANQNNAGVYGTVMRAGRLAVGQTIVLHR
ncbi:MAG: MOSC domain-containing protein [Acidobacteriota bacterium]